jgi:hypothetical protein
MLSALQFWNGLSTQGKVATATAIALPVLYGAKKVLRSALVIFFNLFY